MIYPAIDLIGGKCVRLYKGDFNQRTDYDITPLEVARLYESEGAEWIHIVDLDGAKHGKTEQAELIMKIARESGLRVQTGGGLRDLSHIQRLLQGGVERVVIGSLAISNPQMVKFWLGEFDAGQIVLALDVKLDEQNVPYPATRGWVDTADKNLWDVIDDYAPFGLANILVTDIGRDGALVGGNLELYTEITEKYPHLNLITSGGVGTLDHVRDLKALNPYGIIIGKALYEEKFTVSEAIAC